MALVARTRQRDHLLKGPGTLLYRCQEAGLPMTAACSGQGACGKCVLTVLAGADTLEPATAHEQSVLARNGAGADQRLACQCQPSGRPQNLLITTGYW